MALIRKIFSDVVFRNYYMQCILLKCLNSQNRLQPFCEARIPRADCPNHGVTQMKVPRAEKRSRFTLAFEAFAIKVLKSSRSVPSAKELLKLGWGSLHSIMESAVQRGAARCSAGWIAGAGRASKWWAWTRRVSCADRAM